MTYRVLINGASGRMGHLACDVVSQLKNFMIVAQCGRQDVLGTVIKKQRADIVIDVTTAATAYENLKAILDAGARPIIGTSGLQKEQIDLLSPHVKAQGLGGIIVPNFSLGAILMMRFAAEAARYYKAVEIVEMHHEQKKDAPSGTAIKTAEMINAAHATLKAEGELAVTPVARGGRLGSVSLHSVRLPGVLAKQQVIFGGLGETLTIEHNTLDRQAFAAGIRLACEKVMFLNELVYGLDQLID